jgi:hypothetical protein
MNALERVHEIDQALNVLRPAWNALSEHIVVRIREHTATLVSQNDEQTRGRIKALQELLELPVTLQQERDGISAGLSEEDPA